jgi:hypothetical protein
MSEELRAFERRRIKKDIADDFESLKIQGASLVKKGDISKEEYYKKIREKAIEYRIISEDEYPGYLPGYLEDAFRIVGNVAGGIGAARKGFVGYSASVGAGGAGGQSVFDALNVFFTKKYMPGVETKPIEKISQDVVNTFMVDTALTGAIDKGIQGTKFLGKKISSGFAGLGDAALKKIDKKIKAKDKIKAGKESYKDRIRQQDEIIKELEEELLEQNVSPTRYMIYGARDFGEALRGYSDALGVLPIVGRDSKIAFKNTLKELFLSATEGVEKNAIKQRSGFFNPNAFVIEKNQIVRNPTVSDQFIKDMPMTILRNVQHQAARKAVEVDKLYTRFYDDLRAAKDPRTGKKLQFGKYETVVLEETGERISLAQAAKELNETLKEALGETTQKFSKDLPKDIKSLIPLTKQQEYYTGLKAGVKTIGPKNNLSAQELADIDIRLRNLKNRIGAYERQGVMPEDKLKSQDIVKIRNIIKQLIAKKDVEAGTNLSRLRIDADTKYKLKENFLDNNRGAINFSNYIESGIDNIDDAVRLEKISAQADNLGNKLQIKNGRISIAGRPYKGKTQMDGPEMLDYYMNSNGSQGIKSLSRIMNVTDETGKVIQVNPEFRRLILNEFENMFDDTMFASLRKTGAFESSGIRKRLGFSFDKGSTEVKERTKAMIKEADLNFTLRDLDKFTKYLDGFQPDPNLSKFLMRRFALSSSSGLSLNSLIPIAGTATAGSLLGGPLVGLGIMMMFNRFITGKYGKGKFAKVDSKGGFKKFFTEMFNTTKDFADRVNNKGLSRLGSFGENVGNVIKFTTVDSIGENLDQIELLSDFALSNTKSGQDVFGGVEQLPPSR